jgi:serine/threonine-protein kinase
VYLARAEGLGGFTKLVVVKTLRPDLADDPKFSEMFLDEARLAARLNHRNIVQTNDVGAEGRSYYMVMDYLEGRSFWRIQKAEPSSPGLLPLDVSVRIIADMLAGLHYAHELTDFDGKSLGVVHRDVCPANVFVTTDGQVKVVDFGVAKAKNHAHETQAGTIKGRVVYMSPEQVIGTSIDRRADLFSAGIMLWEAIENRRFWEGKAEAQVLGALIKGDFPKLTSESCPEALREITNKALASSPDDRFATAEEMRLALEAWLETNEKRGGLVELGRKVKELMRGETARIATLTEASVTLSREESLPALEPGSSTDSSIGSRPRPTASASVSVSHPSESAPAAVAPSIPVPAQKRPMALVVGVAALAVVAVVAVAANFLRTPSSPTGSSQPSASVAAADAATSAQPDTRVSLVVHVTPASAQISVDDVEVKGNPYETTFPRGSGKHVVRAVASGFAPKTETVDLNDKSVQLGLSLDPQQATAPTGKTNRYVPTKPTGDGPTPPSTNAPIFDPPPTSKSALRPLDTSNPYAH